MKLPISMDDPTLLAVDRAMEKAAVRYEGRRGPNLAMGSIGKECSRDLWYAFRWVNKVFFNAKTLRIFEDGHAAEDLMADRLRMVGDITLVTLDPETGKQIKREECGGHLQGRQDGEILGLIQAPKSLHVWEHKCVNEKKFEKLKKLIAQVGEKHALMQWDIVYYVQHILYIHLGGYKYGYMTVTTPGGRDAIALRTDPNPSEAIKVIQKAKRIAFSDEAPPRISDKKESFKCRFCDFKDICHDGAKVERNCRTCAHSTVLEEGGWRCAFHDQDIDWDQQARGCGAQRYNPEFVDGEVVNASPSENWIEYKMKDGTVWRDKG